MARTLLFGCNIEEEKQTDIDNKINNAQQFEVVERVIFNLIEEFNKKKSEKNAFNKGVKKSMHIFNQILTVSLYWLFTLETGSITR